MKYQIFFEKIENYRNGLLYNKENPLYIIK